MLGIPSPSAVDNGQNATVHATHSIWRLDIDGLREDATKTLSEKRLSEKLQAPESASKKKPSAAEENPQGSRIDPGSVDALRVPGVVLEVSNSLYRLRTCAGVLQTCYRADDLELFQGELGVIDLGSSQSVSDS